MKRYTCAVLIAGMIAASVFPANAQLVNDTTRFSESMWSMKKKKMVLDFMDLTEGEKASFWPLYESYYQSIRFIEMESLELMDICQTNAESMDPHELEKFTKQILLNDLLLAKVRRQYYRKFSKALSPLIATRFMQFDDAIRTMVQMDVKSRAEEEELAKASLR